MNQESETKQLYRILMKKEWPQLVTNIINEIEAANPELKFRLSREGISGKYKLLSSGQVFVVFKIIGRNIHIYDIRALTTGKKYGKPKRIAL